MEQKNPQGCVDAAAGPILPERGGRTETPQPREEAAMRVRIGQEAPDFEATAFHEGRFTKVKLSDYRGKWVLLCFYPGDFTFV